MSDATNFEVALNDPSHTFHHLAVSKRLLSEARNQVSDAFTALRLQHWGKFEKVEWNGDLESTDNGGTRFYTSSITFIIGGQRYDIGHSMDDEFEDLDNHIEELLESNDPGDLIDPLRVAAGKGKLLGITDQTALHNFVLAELTGLDEDRLAQLLWLIESEIDDSQEEGSLTFGTYTG